MATAGNKDKNSRVLKILSGLKATPAPDEGEDGEYLPNGRFDDAPAPQVEEADMLADEDSSVPLSPTETAELTKRRAQRGVPRAPIAPPKGY